MERASSGPRWWTILACTGLCASLLHPQSPRLARACEGLARRPINLFFACTRSIPDLARRVFQQGPGHLGTCHLPLHTILILPSYHVAHSHKVLRSPAVWAPPFNFPVMNPFPDGEPRRTIRCNTIQYDQWLTFTKTAILFACPFGRDDLAAAARCLPFPVPTPPPPPFSFSSALCPSTFLWDLGLGSVAPETAP